MMKSSSSNRVDGLGVWQGVARGGQRLPKVLPRPAMPNPSTTYGQAPLRASGLWSSSTLLDTPRRKSMSKCVMCKVLTRVIKISAALALCTSIGIRHGVSKGVEDGCFRGGPPTGHEEYGMAGPSETLGIP
jgi:hypothetical protein